MKETVPLKAARVGSIGGSGVAAPVLITAATGWEAGPLAKGLGLTPSGLRRWRGTIKGRAVELIQTGMGDRATRASLDPVSPRNYSLVISAGLCGAMQDGMNAGHIVADAQGVELDKVVPLRETAAALKLPFHFGKILHVNKVLQPEAKRTLGAEHRVLACDMETGAVRRWAHEGAPVIAARAVLDSIDDVLPEDAPEDESFGAMAKFALRRPSRLPGLIVTGVKAKSAMSRLSSYLKAYLEAI